MVDTPVIPVLGGEVMENLGPGCEQPDCQPEDHHRNRVPLMRGGEYKDGFWLCPRLSPGLSEEYFSTQSHLSPVKDYPHPTPQ